MFNIGDIIQSRYRIISMIGQGGMAYVYRAEDTKLLRQVAIKLLKDEPASDDASLVGFISEARAAAGLSHPNVVMVYDVVDLEDVHCIVMELAEGITLKNYIQKEGHLSNEETIHIALQAASGIGAAHKKGIIHRDIKPQNIILTEDGTIKVTDFGIALALENADKDSDEIIGSAHYMAPEQISPGTADARTDLYSLGICIYEMLTGRLPFDADVNESEEIAKTHLNNALIPPVVYQPDIYPALNDIVIKALSKDPDDRYQNAAEIIEDLNHASKDPNGHFVRFYGSRASGSSTGGSEKADSEKGFAIDKSEDPGKTPARNQKSMETPHEDTVSAGEIAHGPGKSILDIVSNKSSFFSYRRLIILVGVLAAVLIVGISIIYFIDSRLALEGFVLQHSSAQAGVDETSVSGSDDNMEDDTVDISIESGNIMPDLLGMNIDEAKQTLYDANRNVDSSSTAYSDIYPRDTVAFQSPLSGATLSPDETVYLTVSLGSERDSVLENIAGKTLEEAQAEMQRVGIVTVDPRQEFSETVAEGAVIGYESAMTLATVGVQNESATQMATSSEQSGSATNLESDEPIRLIVSLGSQSNYVSMPNLLGMSLTNAKIALEAQGLVLGTLTSQARSDLPIACVGAQSVVYDSFIKRGSSVDLAISVGMNSGLPDGTPINEDYFSDSQIATSSEEMEDSGDYFYGDIDSVCTVGSASQDGSETLTVGVRLRQDLDDSVVYTQLAEPVPVANGSSFPLYYLNIRGVYGVEEGYVEVYDVNTGEIYASYQISFSAREY